MTVTWARVGAPTENSARIMARVTGSSTRVAVADNDALSGAMFFGPQTPTAQGMVDFTATGLDPDTEYFWQIEDDGDLAPDWAGRFRTHPPLGQPADFTLAIIGDAGAGAGDENAVVVDRVSNHPSFDNVRQHNPLMTWHLGDRDYRDYGSGTHVPLPITADSYRDGYDDRMTFNGTLGADARQGRLLREVATEEIWDNHDYGFEVGSAVDADGQMPYKEIAAQVFREMVPSYDLPDPDALYRSKQIGRVLVAILDVRYYRTPNDSPDDENKTQLGTNQRAWLSSLLSSSDAQFLVLIMPQQWLTRSGSDTWAVFETERTGWLIPLLQSTGWVDRMCIVSASHHALGIDTGTNSPGGIPAYLFAAIDAGGAPVIDNLYDTGPTQPGRGQYGTLRINDRGTEIEVTGIGWQQGSLWRSHSFTVAADDPDPTPEPPPAPPPVARAEVRTRVTWLGCRLTDGRIISEVPDITGQVSRVLGDVTTSGLTLPIPISGPGALPIGLVEQLTEPGRAMIAAIVNDIPTWAGIVGASEGGTEATMSVPVASLEAYLERRIVRTHEFSSTDEALIAATLVGDAGDIPGVGSGIGLEIDAPPTGTLRDRRYLLTDRKTVLEALQELMEVIDGPEWTIDLDWTDDTRTAIAKIFRVRKRIGVAAPSPNAVFMARANAVFGSRDGSEARYRYKIDYTMDHGANYVVAYSSGQEEDQPASEPAIAQEVLDAGYPIYEQHFQPSSNITSQGTLNAHAAAELDRRRRGTRTFTLEARWDAYPRYGVDWELGDDIAWDLVGHRHPQGIRGRGRAIGFTLDMQTRTIRPILEEDQ